MDRGVIYYMFLSSPPKSEARKELLGEPECRQVLKNCFNEPKDVKELTEVCDLDVEECSRMIQGLESAGLIRSVNQVYEDGERFSYLPQRFIVNRWVIEEGPLPVDFSSLE